MDKIYNKQRKKVKASFLQIRFVNCPYFNQKIYFNSDGFYHLRYSSRKERSKQEQLLKFNLFSLAIRVIKRSGTVQEYRSILINTNRQSKKDNPAIKMKRVEYWGFIAICKTKSGNIRIKVILRRIGNGKMIFWSVMPCGKINKQKLYSAGIIDE